MSRYVWLVVLAVASLNAQTYTGSIRGRITDPSGLPVVGAAVTITDTGSNAVRKTATNEVGDYVVSFLKPGDYRLNLAAPGFKESVQDAVRLQLNQSMTIDVRLELGQVTDTVQVAANAIQLNYVSPEIGHVVEAEALINVPLAATNSRGRSPVLLAKLVPGVSSTSYGNINNFSFGGGRPVTNEIMVDGLPTTNPSDQTYTLTPSPDAVQEFKVLTTPFSAEYGHTGGGIMMVTSRSGSNQYHGSAYDYFRNRLLNNRSFFQPAKSTQKYVQNDPGGTFGGPIRIPKVYNGQDKTFFFADFNVTLASNGNLYNQLTPTALERSGDFSQTLAGGKPTIIYDPATTTQLADGKTYTRQPFPGNKIPQARIDSSAAQIVKFYPDPNGSYAGGLNFLVQPPQIRQTWQWIERIDHNFSSNDKIFGRIGGYNPNGEAQQRILNKANNDTSGGFRDTQITLSHTHVFGASLVNDLRVGFVQEHNYTIAGSSPSPELGIKNVLLYEFPQINIQNAGMIPLGSSASNGDRDRSYVFSEALNFVKGRHTLKIGGDYRRQMWDNYSPGKLSGNYTFSGAFTGLPGTQGTGSGFADLLLGYPASTSININDYTYRWNINSSGIYLQDDFKLSSKLTLNLGVRWEYNGPYSEANGQYAIFNPSRVNRQTGNLGDVEFAKVDTNSDHFSPSVYTNFLPRVGFAYNLASKWVVRGGYGMYLLPTIGYGGVGQASQYGVAATFTSLDSVTPRYRLQDGVPAYTYNVDFEGRPRIPASLTSPTASVQMVERRERSAYNQTWQLGFQRQIGQWLAELDYVGTRGVKLPSSFQLNQVRPENWGPGNLQPRRPYPQYVAVGALLNNGNSIYHSLQAKLEHRWHNGLLIQMAYTWSKLIDDIDGPSRANGVPYQDVYNLRADRGIGGYDTPHRFVTSYVYQVPLGRHGKYLNQVPVVKDVVEGWQFSGITEFQVGLPMQVTQTFTAWGPNTQRPNLVAGQDPSLPRGDRTIARWFNTGAFTASPNFTLGFAPRFPLHGPGINNWDLALMRDFKLFERLKMQFRGEAYSATNHPQWGNPGTALNNLNTFGVITSAGGARSIELATRFFF
jgi:outer membrane receptor protein involved in Fe transport